jgi:phosphoglucan, water dikinase
MRQRWRLAELRCEDYSFVLASRFVNFLEASGGGEVLATAHEKAWALPLGMLVLSVRQMGLSGWEPAECMALDQELTCWQKNGLALKQVRCVLFAGSGADT